MNSALRDSAPSGPLSSYVEFRVRLGNTFRLIDPSRREFARSDPEQKNKAELIADLKELYRLAGASGIVQGLAFACALACVRAKGISWKTFVGCPLLGREYKIWSHYKEMDEALNELSELRRP